VIALDGGVSLVPLHYAIRALKRRFPDAPQDRKVSVLAGRIRGVLTRIKSVVEALGLDPGKQLRDSIADFEMQLNGPVVEPVAAAAPRQERRRARSKQGAGVMTRTTRSGSR
jgi:hypothetical protein